MLHDNMDLSRLMVHVQQVEDSQKKRGVHDARRTNPHDQAGLAMEVIETILASVSSPDS